MRKFKKIDWINYIWSKRNAMAKNKTTETDVNVEDFVNKVGHEGKRNDSFKLMALFSSLTGKEPKMWGPTIIGFDSYHYKYASGHEGEAPLAGFSPRKDAIVLYFASDYKDRDALLEKLGKHKSSKACIYVKKLEDIDLGILEQMILNSMAAIRELYP